MTACAAPIRVTVYTGTSNDFWLAAEAADGTVKASLADVTRVTLLIGATLIDSAVVGSGVIWWTDTATYKAATVDVIKFRLGAQALTAGEYADCALTIYDATYTGGQRMATALKVTVV